MLFFNSCLQGAFRRLHSRHIRLTLIMIPTGPVHSVLQPAREFRSSSFPWVSSLGRFPFPDVPFAQANIPVEGADE